MIFLRTISMISSVPVGLDTLVGAVRWRLMNVCLVLVRMEGHVLTLLTGISVTVAVSLW